MRSKPTLPVVGPAMIMLTESDLLAARWYHPVILMLVSIREHFGL